MFEAAAGLGALGGGAAKALWSYNRENYFLDTQLWQNRVHQVQGMRINEASLFREDIRDIFGLTVQKMDQYLVVNTLQLGFGITMFYDGRLPGTVQPWLFFLYAFTLVGAITFLLLSIWLSIQASITAQSFVVKLLTMSLRLPIPSVTEMQSAMGGQRPAAAFEANLPDQFRLPVAGAQGIGAVDVEKGEGNSPPIRLYQGLQQHWVGWDAYARVCMTLGTLALLQGISFFTIGFFTVVGYQPFLAFCATFTLCVIQWIVIKIDFFLTPLETKMALVLVFTSPLLTVIAEIINAQGVNKDVPQMICPFVFFNQFLYNSMFLYLSRSKWTSDGAKIPIKYRSVVSNNIFGQSNLMVNQDSFTPPDLAPDQLFPSQFGSVTLPGEVPREGQTPLTMEALVPLPVDELARLLGEQLYQNLISLQTYMANFERSAQVAQLSDDELIDWSRKVEKLKKVGSSLPQLLGKCLLPCPQSSTLIIFDHKGDFQKLDTLSGRCEPAEGPESREVFLSLLNATSQMANVLTEYNLLALRCVEDSMDEADPAILEGSRERLTSLLEPGVQAGQVYYASTSASPIDLHETPGSRPREVLEKNLTNLVVPSYLSNSANVPWKVFLLLFTVQVAGWGCATIWGMVALYTDWSVETISTTAP